MSPPGRPKAENPKAMRFSVRLDAQQERELELLCRRLGITKGEAIRQGIDLLLAKEKEHNG